MRVYKTGSITAKQLEAMLEAARWAPSGANTQPWEFVVTRDRSKMKRCREIFYNEWKQRKLEDPVNYKGLSKYLRQRPEEKGGVACKGGMKKSFFTVTSTFSQLRK